MATTRRASRRIGTLLVAAVCVGALGGFVAWQLRDDEAHTPPARDAAVASVANTDAALEPIDAQVDAQATAALPDAATEVERPAHRVVRNASRVDAGVITVATSPAQVATGTGYLQVVGEDNLGAKIIVDGREVGYAPNKLEVGRGHHRLAIIRKDGTRLTGEIDITEYHSVQRPLRPAL